MRELKGKYVADCFSGCGGVSRCVEAAGFPTHQWDIKHGAGGDLTAELVIRQLISDIRAGRVLAVMLAPPCSSFSIARDRNSQVRTSEWPGGLPNLPARLQAVVHTGNRCARAALRVIRTCLAEGVPFAMENPRTSRIFLLPGFRQIVRNPAVHERVIDFCQYGVRWKKPTKFIIGHVSPDGSHRLCRRCHGRRCSRTGRAHLHLTGHAPGGVPWTLVAQPYPAEVNEALAHTLLYNARARFLKA